MPISFPTGLDAITNPIATDPQNNPSHSAQHSTANDILEALEAKVGIDSSAITTSHDYKIAQLESTRLTSANIVATITNGVTDKAPSEDAVYDALSLKASLASPTFTGTVNAGVINSSGVVYVTGANGADAASRAVLDQKDANTSRLIAQGPNATTKGAWEFGMNESDGGSYMAGINISNTGLVTIPTGILNFLFNAPEGTMYNGRILPSVTSNNLTVALKTLAGTDPSASDPVYVMIGGVVRSITGALNSGEDAGTNFSNAGSAELATKEIDWFCYLGFEASNSTMSLLFSRYPAANLYSDFSGANSTGEKNVHTNNTLAATDAVVNIGRFAATLSAGAGYTWSVPTFTASNLIQKPWYEMDEKTWLPVFSGGDSMTVASPSIDRADYKIIGKKLFFNIGFTLTTDGTAATTIYFTLPFTSKITGGGSNYVFTAQARDGGGFLGGIAADSQASGMKVQLLRYDVGNFGLGATRGGLVSGFYEI